MRLIDADALIEEHCKGCGQDIKDGCKTDPVCATLMWFEDAPTIDAVPVVRCKDCRAMYTVGHGYRWCKVWERMLLMGEDGFCSYGERKDGEG